MRAILSSAAVALSAMLLIGCGSAPTADIRSDSSARAEYIGTATISSMQFSTSSAVEAEELAARMLTTAVRFADAEHDTVEVLDWEGTTTDPDGAMVIVRVTSTLTGSTSIRCWSVAYFARDLRATEAQDVDCPNLPARTPVPAEIVPFDRTRIVELVSTTLSTGTVDELPSRLESALAGQAERVVIAEHGGEVVVAVRGQGQDDCVVGVRHLDASATTYISFQKNALLLGEMGCDPGLYFSQLYIE